MMSPTVHSMYRVELHHTIKCYCIENVFYKQSLTHMHTHAHTRTHRMEGLLSGQRIHFSPL